MVRIIKEKIGLEELKKIAAEGFGTLIKVAVDVEKGVLAAGGEWHSEGQDWLVLQEGSQGENIWGANLYLFEKPENRIEYIALINIKPSLGNREMLIGDKNVRDKIKSIINNLLLADGEIVTP